MPRITIGKLARLCEIDPRAIRRAVQQGQITRGDDGLFDQETAIYEWRNAIHHPMQDDQPAPVLLGGPAPSDNTKAGDYAKARAAVHIYEARLKRLRYEERARTLAPVRDIEAARFNEMRIIRDACMNIPARVSAQLAAEGSEHKIYQLLENEIIQVFQLYADGKVA
jgi:hypothetical protein